MHTDFIAAPGNLYGANGAGVVLAEKGHFDVSKDIFTQVGFVMHQFFPLIVDKLIHRPYFLKFRSRSCIRKHFCSDA